MSTPDPSQRSRPEGVTSGSERRPSQLLVGPLLTFDLAAETARLRQEASWQQGDRNAKTLAKEDTFRCVLTLLRAGARLEEHATAAYVSVQTLSGRLRLRAGEQTVELPAGHLLVLAPDLPHDVEALEESSFLLTLTWLGRGRP